MCVCGDIDVQNDIVLPFRTFKANEKSKKTGGFPKIQL